MLLTVASEQGPVLVYDDNGKRLGVLRVAGPPLEVDGLPIRITHVLSASGLLIKRDPGVPLVYAGFAVALLGGGLSVSVQPQTLGHRSPGPSSCGGYQQPGRGGLW